MARFCGLLVALCSVAVLGGCCGANRCNPCGPCSPCGPGGPCGVPTMGTQGFGTYGGYGTQFGSTVTPGTTQYYTAGDMTQPQPTINAGQPVAAISPVSYSDASGSAGTVMPAGGFPAASFPAASYPVMPAPMTAAAPRLDSLPTY